MSSDIRSILEKLSALQEGQVTPVGVKQGLNKQQKSVHQLPALFKPHGIRALGAKKDPTHPMSKELVGDSLEPSKNALEEAMQDVEEDMISKVKRDLTQYLDQLEKKVSIDRELTDKAKDAVKKRQAEEDEELEEDDYELTDPSTVHGIEDEVDQSMAQPQQPVKVMEIEQGQSFEIYEYGNVYEVRYQGRALPSRFKSADDAAMAVDLFKARRNQSRQQDLNQDYIKER
jgi:hypothetical protein